MLSKIDRIINHSKVCHLLQQRSTLFWQSSNLGSFYGLQQLCFSTKAKKPASEPKIPPKASITKEKSSTKVTKSTNVTPKGTAKTASKRTKKPKQPMEEIVNPVSNQKQSVEMCLSPSFPSPIPELPYIYTTKYFENSELTRENIANIYNDFFHEFPPEIYSQNELTKRILTHQETVLNEKAIKDFYFYRYLNHRIHISSTCEYEQLESILTNGLLDKEIKYICQQLGLPLRLDSLLKRLKTKNQPKISINQIKNYVNDFQNQENPHLALTSEDEAPHMKMFKLLSKQFNLDAEYQATSSDVEDRPLSNSSKKTDVSPQTIATDDNSMKSPMFFHLKFSQLYIKSISQRKSLYEILNIPIPTYYQINSKTISYPVSEKEYQIDSSLYHYPLTLRQLPERLHHILTTSMFRKFPLEYNYCKFYELPYPIKCIDTHQLEHMFMQTETSSHSSKRKVIVPPEMHPSILRPSKVISQQYQHALDAIQTHEHPIFSVFYEHMSYHLIQKITLLMTYYGHYLSKFSMIPMITQSLEVMKMARRANNDQNLLYLQRNLLSDHNFSNVHIISNLDNNLSLLRQLLIDESFGPIRADQHFVFIGDLLHHPIDRLPNLYDAQAFILLLYYKILFPQNFHFVLGPRDYQYILTLKAEILSGKKAEIRYPRHKKYNKDGELKDDYKPLINVLDPKFQYNTEIRDLLVEVFETFLLGVVVDQEAFVCSGGPSHSTSKITLQDINELQPFNTLHEKAVHTFLNAAPVQAIAEKKFFYSVPPAYRKEFPVMTKKAIHNFLETNKLKMIIRSYNDIDYLYTDNNLVSSQQTVGVYTFSSSNLNSRRKTWYRADFFLIKAMTENYDTIAANFRAKDIPLSVFLNNRYVIDQTGLFKTLKRKNIYKELPEADELDVNNEEAKDSTEDKNSKLNPMFPHMNIVHQMPQIEKNLPCVMTISGKYTRKNTLGYHSNIEQNSFPFPTAEQVEELPPLPVTSTPKPRRKREDNDKEKNDDDNNYL